ncbi:Phenylacetic acid catabolic protein [Amycolatopsis alkalitolerans]|uniref:Phenylacetic acid catabolic protein n=1 Tax=Amycolatopsis alkalitolerans TaxID=2547244 RepID=UPI001359D0CA|nr:Phenylacetic acid catabolic protein [Amycolatopsis alkalitolerans]
MTSDKIDAEVREPVQDELLCLADTKLVLGNWFAECVMNGKSLPDFAAMLGMCTASYGQTRAIYRYLDLLDHSYGHLEKGRAAGEIRSMDLLDEPPRDWPDFIISIWLAEQASWSMASGFLRSPDRTIAGIARKIGEEAYFHLKYASGWLRILNGADDDRGRAREALSLRWPLALRWFGPAEPVDRLAAAGWRDPGIGDIRAGLADEVQRSVTPLGIDLATLPGPDFPPEWRPRARRTGSLPARLFEVIRFKDAELAR